MRKSKPKKRTVLPDPKYNDVHVSLFVNHLMRQGKKSVAYRIFYDALDLVKSRAEKIDKIPAEKTSIEIWKKAMENVAPSVEVKSRRIGGATFQVPIEVGPVRKIAISMKNIILYAKKRGGKPMSDKLAAEILAAYAEEGGAFKKKEDTHKMAEANKAFAHFKF